MIKINDPPSPAIAGAVFGILLFLAAVACSLTVEDPPEWSALSPAERTAVYQYVECVNSRFPLDANRWAYVTDLTVARELSDGSLDLAGMRTTYASLGCGDLEQETGS